MIKILMAFVLACSGYAWAHPGEHHDSLFATLVHLLTEPDHLAMAAAAIIVGALGAGVLRRRAAAKRRMFGRR